MSTSKSAGKHRSTRQKAADVSLANRETRPVFCRHCISSMLMGYPASRAADACRNGRVSCTDRLHRTRETKLCLECIVGGRDCDPIHPSRQALVLDLQAKYLAAFGKAAGSPEYNAWQAAARACCDQDSNALPGIARLKKGEVKVMASTSAPAQVERPAEAATSGRNAEWEWLEETVAELNAAHQAGEAVVVRIHPAFLDHVGAKLTAGRG